MDFKKFFQRKKEDAPQEQTVQDPQPLSIEGIPPAPLTPEPDDAEIAAQALLEYMVSSSKFFDERSGKAERQVSGSKRKSRSGVVGHAPKRDGRGKQSSERLRVGDQGSEMAPPTTAQQPETLNLKPETRNAEYYRHLAWRMQKAREAARLRVTRFLAFVEQELKKPDLPAFGDGSLGLLEAELFKRQDIVEREKGELLRRWQHCLAVVTVRLMQATHNLDDNDNADSSPTTN